MKGKITAIAVTILLAAVLPLPQAAATVTANAGPDKTADTGQSITFDATASSASGESIASYNWDFGDGSSTSGATVAKTYGAAGTYTVTLVVVGTSGSTSVDAASVVVRSTDTAAPTITHTAVTAGTANSLVSVSATVTDNIGIASATLHYKRWNESTYQSTTMSCTGSATSQTCEGSIPAGVTDGPSVQYYIRATDTRSGTPNTASHPASAPTSNLTVTLTDTAAPTITHTPPTLARAGQDLNVTATIADTVGVDTVRLLYDFDASTSFSFSTTMQRASGSSTSGVYYALISGSQLTAGSTVKYYIEANDTSNNVAREPSSAPGCFGAGTCTGTTLGISSAAAPAFTHTATTSATAGQGIPITATVTVPSGALTGVALYYRSIGNTTDFAAVSMTNATSASTYSATIPAGAVTDRGVEYYLRANATGGTTNTTPSAGATAPYQVLTPPGSASGLATARTSTGVSLSWSAPATSASDSVGSYRIQRSLDNAAFSDVATVTAPTTTYLDATATAGVRWYYKVVALDTWGTQGAASSAAASGLGVIPAMPAVTATPASGTITLSWAAVSGASRYVVSVSADNATFVEIANTTGTSASGAGLTNGQAYHVRVVPMNAFFETGAAAFVSATPVAPSTGNTGGSGNSGSTTVPATVTITSPANGATLTSGTVAIMGSAGGTGVNAVQVTIGGVGTFVATGVSSWIYTWSASGLADGAYTITATPVGGTSAPTASVTVTLDLVPAPATPATPTPATPTPADPTPASPTPASPTPDSPTPASPTPATPTPATPTPPVGTTPTPATVSLPPGTTPTPSTPTATTPRPSPTPTPTPVEDDADTPGFEAWALAAALGAALLVLRRRK